MPVDVSYFKGNSYFQSGHFHMQGPLFEGNHTCKPAGGYMREAGCSLGWVVHGADGGCDAGEYSDRHSKAERQNQDMPPQQPQLLSQRCPLCQPATKPAILNHQWA